MYRGVQVNIAIMRAFVRLREMPLTKADLARKVVAFGLRPKPFTVRLLAVRVLCQFEAPWIAAASRSARRPRQTTHHLERFGCVVEEVHPDLSGAADAFLTLRAWRSWSV
jgi:hypothetical protein